MTWPALSTDTIGFWAALLTTVSFLPQVVRTWRMGGQELSWLMLALFGTGVGLWFLYGYLLQSGPLMLANGITGLQILALAVLKCTTPMRRPRVVVDEPPATDPA